jgi:competence protein ComEA
MKQFIVACICAAVFYAGSALAAVNINTADANALASLPGIGSVKAQAIIKDREQNGPYHKLNQLTRVKGIGEKTVERLSSEATVGAQSSDKNSG